MIVSKSLGEFGTPALDGVVADHVLSHRPSATRWGVEISLRMTKPV